GLDEITAGRLDEIWIPILPEVLRTPPWGHGLGSVMWSNAMKFEEMFFVTHPHNAYLQAYMDLGAIGTFALIPFCLHSWRIFRLTHPPNAYLQAYMGLGAIGTFALIAFWLHSWWSFRKFASDSRITPELQGFFEGAAAGLVSFLVAGIRLEPAMPVPEQSFL